MSTLSGKSNASVSVSKAATNGAIAGLVGGVVFGIMMAMQGMLPMVGMLIRQESAASGFMVHMLISAFIGAVYGIVISRFDLSSRTDGGHADSPGKRGERVHGPHVDQRFYRRGLRDCD
jgi:hypothetical protein